MTQVQKANQIGILGNIRQRMGADSETDTSFDNDINELTNQEVVEQWTGWNLGSESWGATIIKIFIDLNELDSE